MSMWMKHSWIFTSDYFIYMPFNWFNKLRMLYRRISRDLFLSIWSCINIKSDNCLNPFFELWHFLTRKLISTPWYMNTSIIIENKLSIFKTPSIIFEPLLFISYILWSFNFLLFKNSLQLIESLHLDLFLLNKNNNKLKIVWTILIMNL